MQTKLPRFHRHLARPAVVHRPFASQSIFVPGLGTSFPHRWLRDSCQCGDCVHHSTQQKLHRTSDVLNSSLLADLELSDHELRVTWRGDPPHKSVYPIEWLRNYASTENRTNLHRDLARSTWNAAMLRDTPKLFLDYSNLHDDNDPSLSQALINLIRYGIVFLRGVPHDATNNHDCELRQLASFFGRIRDTFYGQVWDVKNVKNSTNIAYTNLNLGLHMDLLYFQHPPRYQILHCLRNRVQGGRSIFVDAIHTAEKLRTQAPPAFEVLSRTLVPYHYINDGHHLHHTHPIISLSSVNPGNIEYVNYSPPFQAPLLVETPGEFFEALYRFASLLDNTEDRFEHTLREGEAVIFDNRRVLHARTEFYDVGDVQAGETTRWLKGCYLEADDVLDNYRRLAKKALTESAVLFP